MLQQILSFLKHVANQMQQNLGEGERGVFHETNGDVEKPLLDDGVHVVQRSVGKVSHDDKQVVDYLGVLEEFFDCEHVPENLGHIHIEKGLLNFGANLIAFFECVRGYIVQRYQYIVDAFVLNGRFQLLSLAHEEILGLLHLQEQSLFREVFLQFSLLERLKILVRIFFQGNHY